MGSRPFKAIGTAAALAVASLVIAASAGAGNGADRYFLGSGSKHSKIGIHVSGNEVETAFVEYRSHCTLDGKSSGNHGGLMVRPRPIPINDRARFRYSYDQRWTSNAEVHVRFKGEVGKSVRGAYKSRYRGRSHDQIEKCKTGIVRFNIGKTSRKAYERAFEATGYNR